MQALMLAAGMGRRMGKHTEEMTKCMMRVGGRTLLERAVEALREAGITRFVMVVGWECDKLIDFIEKNISGMEFEFIYNYDYENTNNIYSLYMAREHLIKDDTILLESDLVYDKGLIKQIVDFPEENLVAVAKYEHWMDGTVATLTPWGTIQDFIEKKDFRYEDAESYYKTVNIYKFSKAFSANQYLPFLEAYIKAYGKQQYYEQVLKAIAHISYAQLKAYVLNGVKWYEIDDAQDLDIAETLFAPQEGQLWAYERHFGGYWRFGGLRDFCYLVNPYFPPRRMVEQMKYFFDPLLRSYPSGMGIQKLLAEKLYHVDESYLLVGNGAAELISVLGRCVQGEVSLPVPAFNEYIRCFTSCKIHRLYTKEDDFRLNKEKLIERARAGHTLFLINPDNPSGSFLKKDELLEVLDACDTNGVMCVVDESFADFAARQDRFTLLEDRILERYKGLVVIKSISKSYGIPGLRLGVLASADRALVKELQRLLPVWNINSFAEYFLQIFDLYRDAYVTACDRIARQRQILADKLNSVGYLQAYDSAANYLMCRVIGGYSSHELATRVLQNSDILIKDFSGKEGFFGEDYIRVAVKDEKENECLYQALKALEGRICK